MCSGTIPDNTLVEMIYVDNIKHYLISVIKNSHVKTDDIFVGMNGKTGKYEIHMEHVMKNAVNDCIESILDNSNKLFKLCKEGDDVC